MYFKPISLRLDHGAPNYAVAARRHPVFSWGAEHSGRGQRQSAYKITVFDDEKQYWNSGWVATQEQSAKYNGADLPSVRELQWELKLKDAEGRKSEAARAVFRTALFEQWPADWITAPFVQEEGRAIYFIRQFRIDKAVKDAVLCVCGIGYHQATVNGAPASDCVLEPVHANYARHCYYTMHTVTDTLVPGKNSLGVIVGNGWRRNDGAYLHIAAQPVAFFGTPQLTAALFIRYTDGTSDMVATDTRWRCTKGAIVYNHLFNGEIYDSNCDKDGWDLPWFDLEQTEGVVLADSVGVLKPQAIEPIRIQKKIRPVFWRMSGDGAYILDFGENMAGFAEIRLPAGTPRGTKIVMQYGEMLDDAGELFTAPLRSAKARDVYISGAHNETVQVYRPAFTYHGFRYLRIEGWPCVLDCSDVTACAIYSDVDNASRFRCGNSLINDIYRCILRTERSNILGIATDCPQRDERQGWLNDATVRFEKLAYEFDVGALLPKLIEDIAAEQLPDGAIGCTAPFVYGTKPADPVCSSFLIAAMEAYMHTGNLCVIKDNYPAFRAWNEVLRKHSENGIVSYSNYGDWAGPEDCCAGPEDAHSIVTPGLLMSTGYHYLNYKLLARFAELLQDPIEHERNIAEAKRVQRAFLDKWFCSGDGTVATGSQGCQAFALWLGILPEQHRKAAAEKLHRAVKDAGYRVTTGNLTTRYLFDMLTEYGYVEDAWRLMTRTAYPSLGYMLQHEATTIWERFELKRTDNMNSHNHPMYGAVSLWFYKYLAGVRPMEPGWKTLLVAPYIPEHLSYVQTQIETVRGMVSVKWCKRFGKLTLQVGIPFGSRGVISFAGRETMVGSGYYTFEQEQ